MKSTLLMELEPTTKKATTQPPVFSNSTPSFSSSAYAQAQQLQQQQQSPSSSSFKEPNGFCLIDSEKKRKYFLYFHLKSERDLWYAHLDKIIYYHQHGGGNYHNDNYYNNYNNNRERKARAFYFPFLLIYC